VLVACIAVSAGVAYALVARTLWPAQEPALSTSIVPGASIAAVALVCGFLLLGTREGLTATARRLTRMRETGDIETIRGRVSRSVGPLITPLNHLLESVGEEVSQARAEKRQIEIQSRIALTEKHHTEAIIYSISDAVIATNRYDEIILANQAAEKLLGFRLDDAMRKPIEEILDDTTLIRLIVEMRSSDHVGHREVSEHSFDRNGQSKTFNVTLSSVAGPAGEPFGVVAVLHDVTREKEIAQMKTDFVSSVSHELKTPLASIKAYIEMLLDGEVEDDKTRQEFYQIISSESDRLSRLIENILGISRIEAGVTKVVRAPVSLTGVVKQALDVARPQAQTKNIQLVDQLAPVFYQVEADQDMIYQAVLNLISNAIKYTDQGGTVTVRVGVDEGRGVATCEVEDTGLGIPADDLPHVFDKFYRVKANKKLAKGTGLGLTLVKHIVETVHEGKLTVTSDEGHGSTFALEMPVLS
jgi:two-component system phosphate regulon sensor histidine kinase PhoR